LRTGFGQLVNASACDLNSLFSFGITGNEDADRTSESGICICNDVDDGAEYDQLK
jgi:hypothetical protein